MYPKVEKMVCEKCGSKKLSVAYMEKLMESYEDDVVEDVNKAWRVYRAGASEMFGSYKKSPPRVIEPRRCNCELVANVSPVGRILREEYREQLQAKFGDGLSLPLLLALPSKFVAWENSALVSVTKSDEGTLVISDAGDKLIDVIVRMAMRGHFCGGVDKLKDSDVLSHYTYLHMVKPVYRSALALQLGPKVSVCDFFSSVDVDWLQWEVMASIQCDLDDNGDMTLSWAPGVSAVGVLAHELACGMDKMLKPLVPHTRLSVMSTCVQFLPLHSERERTSWLYGEAEKDQTVHVNLAEGTSFLPYGYVVLVGSQQAVTFDPGVTLVMSDGTVIFNDVGGVTLFVNGQVMVELRASGSPELSCFPRTTTSHREFFAGVTVLSYTSETALARWYRRRFDVLSTEARFSVQQARVLVLYSPEVLSGRTKLSGSFVSEDLEKEEHDGCALTTTEYKSLSLGKHYQFSHRPTVLTKSRVDGPYEFVLNGTCALTEHSRVAVLSKATFSIQPLRYRRSRIVYSDNSFTGTAWIENLTIADEYHIDGGGPSDDDGYFDETDTMVFIDRHADWLNCHEEYKSSLYDLQGDWTYLQLACDKPGAARFLGACPKLSTVLSAPRHLFDLNEVESTGFVNSYGSWKLVAYAMCTHTWKDLVRSTSAWDMTGACGCRLVKNGKRCVVHFEKDTLGAYLISLHKVDKQAFRAIDRWR